MSVAHICHRCLKSRGIVCQGACPCPIDGRDILVHIQAGECPIGLFKDAPAPVAPTSKPLYAKVFNPPPRDEWPLLARVMSKLASSEDIGVGDTIARIAGGEMLKRWYKKLSGSDCGCTERQMILNRIYPYRNRWGQRHD